MGQILRRHAEARSWPPCECVCIGCKKAEVTRKGLFLNRLRPLGFYGKVSGWLVKNKE